MDEVLKAIEKKEWIPVIKKFYSKDRLGLSEYIVEGKDYLRRISSLGQWEDCPFRIPQQISPINYPERTDFSFEVAKWISLHHSELKGKKVFEIGCGSGLVQMVGKSFGLDIAGCEDSAVWRTAAAVGAALNNLEINVHRDDSKVDEYDVIILSRIFDDPYFAKHNLENARRLRTAGKRVILSSISLWGGFNALLKLKKNEGKLLFETEWMNEPRIMFDLC